MVTLSETKFETEAATKPKRHIRWSFVGDHAVLIVGSVFMMTPLLLLLTTSTNPDLFIIRNGLSLSIGDQLDDNIHKAMFQRKGFTGAITGTTMLMNSFILGIGFALGKIIISMLAAYAIVYFRLRFATLAFWLIFTTLLLPLEVRILPSYEVVQGLGLINTYTGLIVPLVASATGTFFFRQFFRSVPEELIEAARIDGA
ncbi:MAG: ABC transporter permease subunit, partial [Pseudomonadota bacterium]